MAASGMDPAAASERASHTDGGALFLKRYRHLYEAEKRIQAQRLEALIRSELDSDRTDGEVESDSSLNEADATDGRGWDRTSDLPRVNLMQSLGACLQRGVRRKEAACLAEPSSGLEPPTPSLPSKVSRENSPQTHHMALLKRDLKKESGLFKPWS